MIAEYVGVKLLTAAGAPVTSGATVEISIDGGAWAAPTNPAAHQQNGWWRTQLDATERQANTIEVDGFGGGSVGDTRTYVNVPTATEVATAVWAAATRQLTAAQNFNNTGQTTAQPANAETLGPGAIAPLSFQVDAITAGAIAAGALNGKGDWNIGKTGYALLTAEHVAIALEMLLHDWETIVATVPNFSTFQALRRNRNTWDILPGSPPRLRVYDEAGTGIVWEADITEAAPGNIVTGLTADTT